MAPKEKENERRPGRISSYFSRLTGGTYRDLKKEIVASGMKGSLGDISGLVESEKKKEQALGTYLSRSQISKRQYVKLMKQSARVFLHRLGALEKVVAQYATVIVLGMLALGLGAYSFIDPAVTGSAILDRKFDANFLMFSLILGASALLILAKLSVRMLKR